MGFLVDSIVVYGDSWWCGCAGFLVDLWREIALQYKENYLYFDLVDFCVIFCVKYNSLFSI